MDVVLALLKVKHHSLLSLLSMVLMVGSTKKLQNVYKTNFTFTWTATEALYRNTCNTVIYSCKKKKKKKKWDKTKLS